jgi:hypothetical protein
MDQKMDNIVTAFFTNNWQRKLVALLIAIILWLLVDHSIIETKTIPNVPIRIINLPQDKTILGLLPNGVLQKRISLTLSGSKEIIDKLEPGDLEVILDVSTANSDEWVIKLTKKNLVSLSPDFDVIHNITQVDHSEFVIKISRLITAKIPINILPPVGEPPADYEFLDIWPLKLTQTVTGPEEEVQKLKAKGFDLTFDLADITKQDLDSIKSSPGNFHDDEIRYLVPNKWKQIVIPFHNNSLEDINDPEAQVLRIYFLRKQILPVEAKIPLSIFYPLQTVETINPESVKILSGKYVDLLYEVPVFNVPLYAKNVSRLFLSVVRDSLQITLTAASPKERQILEWSLEVINANSLEDTYVAFLISQLSQGKSTQGALPKKREKVIRQRFREYLKRLKLYSSPEKKFHLESVLEDGKINIINY